MIVVTARGIAYNSGLMVVYGEVLMPIYEYDCTNCNHKFDLIQKINDEPATQCPTCLMNTAVKLVSAAGFQLKGTGWYATDFKNKPSSDKKNTTTETKAAPSVDSSSATTTSTPASSSTTVSD